MYFYLIFSFNYDLLNYFVNQIKLFNNKKNMTRFKMKIQYK